MARAYRWAYMAQPNYNPANNDCPECEIPSKTYFIGGRTENGIAIYTWACQYHHKWILTEIQPIL